MNKDIMSKAVVMSVIFLFIGMSIVPSINALTETKSIKQEIINIKNVKSTSGLPDLLIIGIWVDAWRAGADYDFDLKVKIKNQRNYQASGKINIDIKVYYYSGAEYLEHVFTSKIVNINLNPGQTEWYNLGSGYEPHYNYNFYKAMVTLNIDKTVLESKYYNNRGIQRFYAPGGIIDWIPLGRLLRPLVFFNYFGI